MKTILVSVAIIFSILTCNSARATSHVRDCELIKNEMLRCISNADNTFVRSKVSKAEAIQINNLTVKIEIVLDKLIIIGKDRLSLRELSSKLEQERSLLLAKKIDDDFKGSSNTSAGEIQIINARIEMIDIEIAKGRIKTAKYEALIEQIQDRKNAYFR